MTYEDIVVVDKNDNPIGRAQMPDAYKNGKIVRVVEVIVLNKKHELLIQKRGEHILAPGRWGYSAGGHVDHSDTYMQAAKRELQEEMGIEAREYTEYLYEYEEVSSSYGDQPARRFRKHYLAFSEQTPQIDNDEVVDYRYLNIKDLRKYVFESPQDYMPNIGKSLKKLEQKLADI